MEFWLSVCDDRLEAATFTTDGCINSMLCGSTAAHLVTGMTVSELEEFSEDQILELLPQLPESDRHCARLAVLVLTAAIAQTKGTPITLQEIDP